MSPLGSLSIRQVCAFVPKVIGLLPTCHPPSLIATFSFPKRFCSNFNIEDSGPPLSDEQEDLVQRVLSGRNVFYTGVAGTGKSRVLRAFVKGLRRKRRTVHVVAPTGRAALAVNGMTTWTYAGWSPSSHAKPLHHLRRQAWWRDSYATDVLVIDEVSMVENHHLERLNHAMQEGRWHHYLRETYIGWKELRQSKQRRVCLDFPKNRSIWDALTEQQKAKLSRNFPNGQADCEKLLEIRRAVFGGCQVVVSGDFCQLPPVKPFQHCLECGSKLQPDFEMGEPIYCCPECDITWRESDKWAFQSEAWKKARFEHVELHQVHRQKDDPEFVKILHKIRLGKTLPPSEISLLMDPNRATKTDQATRLFPTRAEVGAFNKEKFEALTTKPYTFEANDIFKWNEEAHPELKSMGTYLPDGTLKALKEHRFEPLVQLKVGMQVVLLANVDIDRGLVNGSQGEVLRFISVATAEKETPLRAPAERLRGEGPIRFYLQSTIFDQRSSYKNDSEVYPVVRFSHDIEGREEYTDYTVFPECSILELGNEGPRPRAGLGDSQEWQRRPTLLCRTQMPLMAAWAMSIHKAQGMTLKKVVVNLSRAFENGQVYVALSRATSLKGLKMEGSAKGLAVGKFGDYAVNRFYRREFGYK